MTRIICEDGTNFLPHDAKCVGSVATKRSRDIHDATCGDYPVLVEQFGGYRMFTYASKITAIIPE